MKYSNTAEDNPELREGVEVGDDAGDDPGHVENIKNRDSDQAGGEQAPEVPDLPVLDDNDEEGEVEDEGEQ